MCDVRCTEGACLRVTCDICDARHELKPLICVMCDANDVLCVLCVMLCVMCDMLCVACDVCCVMCDANDV